MLLRVAELADSEAARPMYLGMSLADAHALWEAMTMLGEIQDLPDMAARQAAELDWAAESLRLLPVARADSDPLVAEVHDLMTDFWAAKITSMIGPLQRAGFMRPEHAAWVHRYATAELAGAGRLHPAFEAFIQLPVVVEGLDQLRRCGDRTLKTAAGEPLYDIPSRNLTERAYEIETTLREAVAGQPISLPLFRSRLCRQNVYLQRALVSAVTDCATLNQELHDSGAISAHKAILEPLGPLYGLGYVVASSEAWLAVTGATARGDCDGVMTVQGMIVSASRARDGIEGHASGRLDPTIVHEFAHTLDPTGGGGSRSAFEVQIMEAAVEEAVTYAFQQAGAPAPPPTSYAAERLMWQRVCEAVGAQSGPLAVAALKHSMSLDDGPLAQRTGTHSPADIFRYLDSPSGLPDKWEELHRYHPDETDRDLRRAITEFTQRRSGKLAEG